MDKLPITEIVVMDKLTITEIVVTDERGQEHALRCSHGLAVTTAEDGAIWAMPLASAKKRAPAKKRALMVAAGRWVSYRLTYAD
jgi:hypothetical protein